MFRLLYVCKNGYLLKEAGIKWRDEWQNIYMTNERIKMLKGAGEKFVGSNRMIWSQKIHFCLSLFVICDLFYAGGRVSLVYSLSVCLFGSVECMFLRDRMNDMFVGCLYINVIHSIEYDG